MDTRCEDGTAFEHRPQHDDPGFEVALGVCPACEGRGCENKVSLENLLCDAAQLIDTIKGEWQPDGSWSDWDQDVRDRITKALRWLGTKPRKPYNYEEIVF